MDIEHTADLTQINRDLNRTFPKDKFFREKSEGQKQLERILIAFCRFDPEIGYVQGMNFIAGSLLYHCPEEIAFWLFCRIVEDYDMRDIYLPGIPGLYKHCQLIDLLLFHTNHALYRHFVNIYTNIYIYIVHKSNNCSNVLNSMDFFTFF